MMKTFQDYLEAVEAEYIPPGESSREVAKSQWRGSSRDEVLADKLNKDMHNLNSLDDDEQDNLMDMLNEFLNDFHSTKTIDDDALDELLDAWSKVDEDVRDNPEAAKEMVKFLLTQTQSRISSDVLKKITGN